MKVLIDLPVEVVSTLKRLAEIPDESETIENEMNELKDEIRLLEEELEEKQDALNELEEEKEELEREITDVAGDVLLDLDVENLREVSQARVVNTETSGLGGFNIGDRVLSVDQRDLYDTHVWLLNDTTQGTVDEFDGSDNSIRVVWDGQSSGWWHKPEQLKKV